ncbi:MAG: SDR family oxidoreductase [Pseudomonadales bacterium]|nr:SDR family oxidoreductase [Halioglobus sp.]MCP5191811.1 SDR family oxidoreductase [Pseudomonadales bacterium]
MNYFVTGGTGFIGRFVVERLLKRPRSKVYILVRKESKQKFEALRDSLGADPARLLPMWGDITTPGLVSKANLAKLKGKIDHVYHLAAVYDLNMSDEQGDRVNNEGTRNVVEFANALGGKVSLQHMSSIAIAGGHFKGVFKESMFDEGQDTSHPYYRTKFQSERIVRKECKVPWRVYRPGAVVGSSVTGEMDKIDGPYYLFPTIKAIVDTVPKWLPLLGVEGGKIPIVPVDYVADATVAIAHKPGLDGKAFQLLQAPQDSTGKIMEIFFDAAHGPGFAKQFELPRMPKLVSQGLRQTAKMLPLKVAAKEMTRATGIPAAALGYITSQVSFDDKQARDALKGTGISCPKLKDYAPVLWSYWESHLDFPKPARGGKAKLAGKVVMVTGASSGIGLESARKFAASGAIVILVARTLSKLQEQADIISKQGGEAYAYSCDLSELADIDRLAKKVLEDFGRVDILVNNAGRSIRRAVMESLDRFHDYERTMQLNYFGCVRLINGLLPSMVANKGGQIINISSIGCLVNAPRFAAYVASKSALDAFSRSLSSEVKQDNIDISTIYMPLVRTPMIAPTKIYNYAPTWSVDKASSLVVDAAIHKTKRIKTFLGQTMEMSYAVAPKLNDSLLARGFQLFPSSAKARGKKDDEAPSGETMALAYLLRGTHL